MLLLKAQEITSRRELFVNLTLRELRGKYKRSMLGWTWSLLNPLVTMAIYSLVFSFYLRVEPDVGDPSGLHNFAFYLIGGLLPFNYMANCLNGGMGALVGNENLIKKVYFPRELLVASSTASWLVSFLIELSVLAVALALVGVFVLPWLPFIILLVALQTVFVSGLALILAVWTVYFRDMQHLMALVLQAWFFTAPIIVPLSLVRDRLGGGILWMVYQANPLTQFVEGYHAVFYDLTAPSLGNLAYLIVVSVGMLWLGIWVFSRFEGRLAEEL